LHYVIINPLKFMSIYSPPRSYFQAAMNVIFLGSAEFGIPALSRLRESHRVLAVVSTPPKPQGRGLVVRDSPVVEYARQSGINEILTPADLKSTDITVTLSNYNADLFVVVAFRILPRSLFALPPLGTVNIHASLLPRYRGPAPIQRAIEAGESETGVTIFRIDDGIDTGAVLLQKQVTIGPKETTVDIYNRLSDVGSMALIEALDGLAAGTRQSFPQDHSKACGAPKLRKEEALIDWHLPPERIFNKIRAFKPFPGTFSFYKGKRLGIVWAEPVAGTEKGPAGAVARIVHDSFDVWCSGGALRIIEVKPEGRTAMPVRDFLSGHALREGEMLS
jgi:methionyl-tRNA formyltransferase